MVLGDNDKITAALAATRVDWFRLLAELLREGKSHAAVSRETSIPLSTIRGWWLQESEPRHYHGEMLIAYWVRVTSKTRDLVPRQRRFIR